MTLRIALGFVLATTLAAIAAAPASATVWLCRPGLANNPCASDLTTTVIAAHGTARVQRARADGKAPIDCFYVYPTVSAQPTTNANLHVDPQQRAVAIVQASRFSTVCRVYAPMYPQLTLHAISTPGGITAQGAAVAYAGLLSAFRDYLSHDNHGRGIIFIGHSQGASMLIALLRREVDAKPAVRRRLVSALLLGGNVTVRRGRASGGDFAHIAACRSATQTGCVVAYSSYEETPPANSVFGRVGTGLNPFKPAIPSALQILCVNPAALLGRGGTLEPYFTSGMLGGMTERGAAPGIPKTPWVSYPNEYSARCRTASGATWLQVTPDSARSDHRPVVSALHGSTWGLHTYDVNLALGDLVALAARERGAYLHPSRR